MSKWMAIGLILAVAEGAASCSRKESTEAVQEPVKPSESIAGEVADAKAGAGSAAAVESVVAEGADLKKVEERTGAFQDMLDSMRSLPGSGTQISAERVDMDSFVRGKTDRELMAFALEAIKTRPYAAMQVLAYLVENSKDPVIQMNAAWDFVRLVPQWGYAADREFALDNYQMLKGMFGAGGAAESMSLADRAKLQDALQSHYWGLGMDVSELLERAEAVRNNAKCDLELSRADLDEASWLLCSGKPEEAASVRTLYERVRARGVYDASQLVIQENVEELLALSDEQIAEEIRTEPDFLANIRREQVAQWNRLTQLTPEERIDLMKSK